MVSLFINPTNENIFNLKSHFYMSVKIYKSVNSAQYFAYQRFVHLSHFSRYVTRYIKFTGHHLTKSYPKPHEEEPKYINCLNKHTTRINNANNGQYYSKLSNQHSSIPNLLYQTIPGYVAFPPPIVAQPLYSWQQQSINPRMHQSSPNIYHQTRTQTIRP